MLTTLNTPALAAIYNTLNADKPVNKFTNKDTAISRVSKLLEAAGLRFTDLSEGTEPSAIEFEVERGGVIIGFLVNDTVAEVTGDETDEAALRVYGESIDPSKSGWKHPARCYAYAARYVAEYDATGKCSKGFSQYLGWVARNHGGWNVRSVGYADMVHFRTIALPAVRAAALAALASSGE